MMYKSQDKSTKDFFLLKHTYRKNVNKEKKNHGFGFTLCCITMCSEAWFNFAGRQLNEYDNISCLDLNWQ